jgi:GNAT superfamily N-acetyltransferase
MFLAEEDGGLVGLLGIEDNELRYSDHHVLVDVYFFVLPEYRGGQVGTRLMKAATLEAERRSLPLFIRITNPVRAKKRGRIGEIAGYIPVGYIVRLR